MLLGLGNEIVVPSSGEAAARLSIQAILRDNARLEQQYKIAMAAYQDALRRRATAMATVEREQAEYRAALQRYDAASRGQAASNGVALATYQADLAAWQKAYDRAYGYGQAMAQMGMASQAVFSKYKIAPPPGYQGCLTKAEHDRMVALCRDQSRPVTVKGLGVIQVGPGTPGCAYAELPVCDSIGPKPPAAGPKPVAPVLGPMPNKPVPPPARVVASQPSPPSPPELRQVPTLVVADPQGPRIVPVSGRSGLATAGLLAAVIVVGGGAAYYYRKRKAQAS